MALSGVVRFLRRTTPAYLHTRSALTSTLSSGSKKVSDRIVKISAIDVDGIKHEVVGLTGQSLLRALANCNLIDPESHRLDEIDACSSECEVRIAQEWIDKMPPQTYEEKYVLKMYNKNRLLLKHARLACQLILTHDLQGMVVAIPKAKPWDIP